MTKYTNLLISILTFLSVLFTNFIAFSQKTPYEINRQKLDSLLFPEARIHQPGYCITILKNQQIIYNKSIGYANVAKKISFTDSTKIALASVSKQFTAMAILMLEEDGKLKLDDDISTYLPELPVRKEKITIQHLLSHTSGLREHVSMMEWENDQKNKYYTFEGTLEKLKQYNGISFLPGEQFAYSNTGYELLAIIIQRVSGMPFEQFMHERIFKPLKMNDTEFSFRKKTKEFGSTASYDYNEKKKKYRVNLWRECNATGATGIYTTVKDFTHWDYNFWNPIICSQQLLDKMNVSDTLNNGGSISYGNGQKYRNFKGYSVVEHAGGWAYFNCQYTRVPELGLSIIIVANNEFDRPYQLAERLLHALVPKDRIAKNSPVLVPKNNSIIEGSYATNSMCIRKIGWSDSLSYYQLNGPGFYAPHKGELFVSPETNCYQDKEQFPICFSSKEQFEWSGGSYFNVPRTFHYLQSDSSITMNSFNGSYECSELGMLKLTWKENKKMFKVKSGFGSNMLFKEIAPCIYESPNVSYRIKIIDSSTIQMGDERVFNVVFKRKV